MFKALRLRGGKDEPCATRMGAPPHFSHQGPDGTWQPYTPAEAEAIAKAITQRPAGGSVMISPPFSIFWGKEAKSERMPTPPSTNMIQVNGKNGNTRVVRRDPPSLEPMAAAYSHRDADGVWTDYPADVAQEIAAAQAAAPAGGKLALSFGGGRFEVRWGSLATSGRMPKPPPSGMIQVNLKTDATREVRCDKESPSAAAAAPAPAPAPSLYPSVPMGLPIASAPAARPAPAAATTPSTVASARRRRWRCCT